MSLDPHPLIIAAIIVVVPVMILIGAMYYVFHHSAKKQLSIYAAQLEDAIKEGGNPQRVVLESRKIEEHFDLLMVLFIKEYNELEDSPIIRSVTIQQLVYAWVDKCTGTLTLHNNRLSRDLAAMVSKDCIETILNNIEGKYQYGDDHAFDFNGKDGSTVYLSNNDFIKVFIKSIRSYNPNHKAFFE